MVEEDGFKLILWYTQPGVIGILSMMYREFGDDSVVSVPVSM